MVAAGALVVAWLVLGVLSAEAVPSGFTQPDTVYTDLAFPTNVEFAPDGRVFIIEKRGTIRSASSIGAPLTQIYDMTTRVHNYWDRGLLGLAVHPQYPGQPYVYVLYTHGVPLDIPGGPTTVWEQGANEICPNPPGGAGDGHGCVVSAQLARLQLNPNTMAVTGDVVLIHDWCQQFPSHSIGDLEFGADGLLYVSGGDGASFDFADYGQAGGSPGSITPRNPCGDPPVSAGQAMPTDGTAEGGALRAQDLRTAGDPVSLSGTVIRIDPMTGAAHPTNPNIAHPDPNGKRVVAYGLRNPYRMTFRPGTNDLYIGDVGQGAWEEVNRHSNPGSAVRNFGWPCFEGGNGSNLVLTSYAGLNICQNLPSSQVTAPLFAYRHTQTITHPTNDDCPPAVAGPTTQTSSSTTGLAFYTGGNYPGQYNGALFGADYSRNCIWVMYPGQNGVPNPNTVEVFHYGPPPAPGQHGISPVDLEMGPDGNMYFVSYLHGRLYRFRYTGGNTPPVAVIQANPSSGPAPLQVQLNGSGSFDPDGHPITQYAWDLNGNGQFNDAFGAVVTHTFIQPGPHTVRLRVTDFPGETGTTSAVIQVSNSPPQPVIHTPAMDTWWSVGDTIGFSGSATDPEEGALPASRLDWLVVLHHCAEDNTCHEHHVGAFNGVASGSFSAPNHEYPSYIEFRLTARDQFGVTTTVSREVHPRTVQLTFRTDPQGVPLTIGGIVRPTPHTGTFIINSVIDVAAPPTHPGDPPWDFANWSTGGSRSHNFPAPSSTTTYTAWYTQVLGPGEADAFGGDGFGVVDSSSGVWYLRDPANGHTTSFFYGNPNDYPFMGDWNCDGISTPGLYRQSDGFVYLRNSNTQGIADIRFFFGNPGDIPIAGDFNNDGCDTVSIYRPSEARFYIINKLGSNDGGLGAADFSFLFGNPGDKPFVGDFNGNGQDTIGLHRETTGLVYFRNTLTTGIADHQFIFGNPGDRLVTGNWAQAGSAGPDTVGVFRPSSGTMFLKFANTQGVADLSFKYGTSTMWPVAGDFGPLPGGSPPPPGS